MSDPDPRAATAVAAATTDDHHAAGDHEPDGGHGHGHEDASEPLGPPDLAAWAYALAGGAVGLVTALALSVASHS